MKSAFLLILISLIFSFEFTHAQQNKISNSDTIDVNSFDERKIQTLFLEKLNSYRSKKGAPVLKEDISLQKAAKLQAEYCNEKSFLTHKQEDNLPLKEVNQRVKKCGGIFRGVSENLLFALINTPFYNKKTQTNYKITTYKALADEMFEMWKNSEGHHANLINPSSDYTGISISLNRYKNKVCAAQVFGSEVFVFPKNGLSYEDTTWGIKETIPSNCATKLGEYYYSSSVFSSFIQQDESNIYLYYFNESKLNKIIKNNTDGIAIDIVSRNQFDCGSNNNLHPSYVFDGKLLTPVYKPEIFKRDVMKNREYYGFLNPLPKGFDSKNMQFNTVTLIGNEVCNYSYPIQVPEKVLDDIALEPLFVRVPGEIKKDTAHFIRSFDIPFSRNLEKQREVYFSRLKQLIQSYQNSIVSIEIKAYSSIEGNEEDNAILHQKRADFIEEVIRKELKSTVPIKKQAVENWEKYYRQIKVLDNETDIKNLNKEDSRNFINESRKDPVVAPFIDKWLDEQRVAEVKIEVKLPYDDKADWSLMPIIYDYTLQKNDTIQAAIAFSRLIQAVANDSSKMSSVLQVKPPDFKKNAILASNYLALMVRFLNQGRTLEINKKTREFSLQEILTYDQLSFLDSINTITKTIKALDFNLAIYRTFLAYHGLYDDSTGLYEITEKNMKAVTSDSILITKEILSKLWYNYYLAGSLYYYNYRNFEKMFDCLDKLIPYLNLDNLSPKEVSDVCLYFNFFFRHKQSIELLEKYLTKFPNDKQLLYLYVTTGAIWNLNVNYHIDYYYKTVDHLNKLDNKRLCAWLYDNFQLKREEEYKKRICSYCGH